MPHRRLDVGGVAWQVYPSGHITQYDGDEFALLFVRALPDGGREVRVSRFSPRGTRSREQALAELSDARLAALLAESQPAATSPEAGYGA
jgi:hypothetical protein